MNKSTNRGKIVGALLLGVAIGGAIGAALGILFAPEKGIVTRKKLMTTGDDLAGAVKEKFNEFVQVAKKEVDYARDKTNELVESGVK
jgi:gas vesicle protein